VASLARVSEELLLKAEQVVGLLSNRSKSGSSDA